MGELLLPRSSRQSLPCGGSTHPQAAASVAMHQAQSEMAWEGTFPDGILLPSAWSGQSYRTDRQPSVGETVIPLNDGHLRSLLKEWVTHYNRGRPHASLGPGIPDLRAGQQRAKLCGHHVPIDQQVVTKAILGGLHHEYSLERRAA